MTTQRAAFLHPTFSQLALFFSGSKYALIDASPKNRNPAVVFGERFIASDFISLVEAGFGSGIDAAVPNPKDTTTVYVFSGNQYALIKATPPGNIRTNLVVDGPKPLSEWRSLREAGFTSVDGALPVIVGNDPSWAYVFSGSKYICLQVDPVNGKKQKVNNIADYWASLKKVGFNTGIDVVLPVPGASKEAYFFKGTKWVRVGNIVYGEPGDVLISGNTPLDVATEWPALHEATFY